MVNLPTHPLFINKIDNEYGHLRVVEYAGRIGNYHSWKCTCTCGNTVTIATNHLNKHSTVKSCGCGEGAASKKARRLTTNNKVSRINSTENYTAVHFSKPTWTIFCETHGEFQCTWEEFLHRKEPCPRCSEFGIKYSLPTTLYVFAISRGKDLVGYKYGITTGCTKKRSKQLSYKTPFSLSLVYSKGFDTGYQAVEVEKKIKTKVGEPLLSKAVFPNGFTETVAATLLPAILNTIKTCNN